MLVEAFAALHHSDMVIGPARDGGFYLIGFSGQRVPDAIFENVEWSTSSVFETVMVNAESVGLSVAVLGEITDIDDAASLHTAMDEARKSRTAPRTRTAMAAMGMEAALVS
jgi:glycosyltransferase A (GT-A) superfamily protein (DUF2064 family)